MGTGALLALLALLGGVMVSAIGPAPAGAADVNVTIGEDDLEPPTVTVEPGSSVVWTNAAGEIRSIVADDASFESGPLNPGDRFQFAFVEARTVTYSIPEVSGATGTVVVQAATGAAATPAPVPTPFAPRATDPTDLATTGDASSVNAFVGGTLIALGAALVMSARRFGWAAALTGMRMPLDDDLLPSRRHRRERRGRSNR